ncbi:hypothetical protein N7517_008272 [Penicillium concentricum]|uniref:Uncharacterized protein n=1 Tax=Penicillium concentricum TaxID=293559 RepID=A0A9W9RS70_9EURO|nr:uncharacterized protein N7517_008272 [Penicillium concentricum]KAJ5365386.1 hypothetical protein N7517_008272 [Penicillium concentricum]
MFQPYNLTSLDHFLPPVHLNLSLAFSLTDKDRVQALQRMEDAMARVLSKFPFLAGMVVPSTQRNGRRNALQVRPATAAELEECHILVTQHHIESTALTVDGKFNTALTPFQIVSPPPNPSPVLRLKANVIGNELHLALCLDHRVMDGSGAFAFISTLGAYCRDLNAPGSFTTSLAQEETRKHIEEIASTATPQDLPWTKFPPQTSEDEVPPDSNQVPISIPHVLDGRKIKMLHDACNSVLQSLHEKYKKDLPEMSLSPNLVVTALVSICSSRARSKAFPDKPELSSTMFVVENLRKALNLRRGYMGNVIVANQSPCDGSAHPPPEALQNIHVPEPLSPVGPEDIWRICNVVQTLQEASGRMDKQYAEGMIATMFRECDWASFRPGWGVDLLVSDIKSAKPFANFGPLGDLQSFDVRFDAFPGICWIMPNPPSDSTSPDPCWRLRWVLERAAMECLSSDPLFHWASV